LDLLKNQSEKTDQEIVRIEAAKSPEETEFVDPLTKIRQDIEKVKRKHEKEINAMAEMVQQKETEIKALEQAEGRVDEEIVRKE